MNARNETFEFCVDIAKEKSIIEDARCKISKGVDADVNTVFITSSHSREAGYYEVGKLIETMLDLVNCICFTV